MQSKFAIRMMTRRAFGKSAAALAAAGAAVMRATEGAARALPANQSMFTIYSFFPIEDGVLTTRKACLSHAKYKRFASLDAAEGNRAHPGCKCAIAAMPSSTDEFVWMFGGVGDEIDRFVYDLRWSNERAPVSNVTVGGLEMPVARVR